MRKIVVALAGVLITVVFVIIISNFYIIFYSDNYIYSDITELPHNKVGVLLGTSKYVAKGNPNDYYDNRINAAVELFNNQKIEFIIVSGDNAQVEYNEPRTMKRDLIAKGIPSEKIFCDYAGFRTFDSMVRAQKVFGQDSFTVISQEFHNERAIFIARKHNIYAIGYNATPVKGFRGVKTNFRELFARVKVFTDIYIFDIKPKFLGEPVEIK